MTEIRPAQAFFDTYLDLSREDLVRNGYDPTTVAEDEMAILAEKLCDVSELVDAWNDAIKLLCVEHHIPRLEKKRGRKT